MSNNIFEFRCGYCNKKLSEVKAPCILMVQTIKCPRCKNLVDIYVLKETENNSNKPIYNPVQEKPEHKPVEEVKD